MACSICEAIQENRNILYRDEELVIMIPDFPASYGHLKIYPVEHFTILEQVPDKLVEKMFIIASKVSTLLFDAMQAQGTNILVQNGIAGGQTENHCGVDIVARKEGDGINLQWAPQKLSEEEMSTAVLKITEFTKKMGFEDEKPKPVVIDDQEEGDTETIFEDPDKENYLIKHLERIP